MIKLNKAPIIEVVVGVQFDRPIIKNDLTFECYNAVKETYPEITENPILPSIIEKLDGPSENYLMHGFHSRKWFINVSGHKLIQIQSDKLLFNWRKTSKEEEYPHFEAVLTEYLDIFKKFNAICNFKDKVNQLEITYVDHILLEDFGLSDCDINKIFKYWNLPKALRNIDNNLSFPYEEINGILNIKLQSAIRNKDQKKLITSNTTARGMLAKDKDINKWFDLGHEILLSFFVDSLTDESKKIWEFEEL